MTSLQDLLISETEPFRAKSHGLKTVLFNGVVSSNLASLNKDSSLVIEQTDFTDAALLEKSGVTVTQRASKDFQHALFIGSRVKDENLSIYLRVLSTLPESGSFFTILPNALGASRFESVLKKLHPEHFVSISKSKCRVFGIEKYIPSATDLGSLKEQLKEDPNLGFNRGELDKGSKCLADTVAHLLSGHVMEFCCGSGALAEELIKQNPAIESIVGYDSNFNAVEQAKRKASSPKLQFHWADVMGLSTKVSPQKTIVINPPFHSRMGEDRELGMRCILAAVDTVQKSKGKLYCVHNGHIPYLRHERLQENVTVLSRTDGFTVWCYET